MTTAAQLDAEIEALLPVWKRAFLELPDCRCDAWNAGECACGNYVGWSDYKRQRQIEHLRSKLLI